MVDETRLSPAQYEERERKEHKASFSSRRITGSDFYKNCVKGSKCRIALVCDWLTTPGGAEKVLLELHRMYPDAPIYTSQYSRKGINWFNDADVRTGWLQIFPKSLRKFLGPLRQIYFSHLNLSDYDLVISVTGAEAKSVRCQPRVKNVKNKTRNNSLSETALFDKESNWSLEVEMTRKANEDALAQSSERRNQREFSSENSAHLSPRKGSSAKHICYCHVPTQYYWQMYDKYVENPGFGILSPVVRFFFKLLVKPLREADYRAAQRPSQFITISKYASDQIKKYYHRDSIIVAPPVEISKFMPNPQTFPQEKAEKSTISPQVNGELSTENTKISTSYPQRQTDLSTENTRVFHKFSTSFPQYHYEPSQPNQRPEIICPYPSQYYIIACRQVTWKRVDLAIEACQELNLPLLVVGDGPEHMNLLNITHDDTPIKFLPWSETRELAKFLQGAKGYIFPSLEPFGIAAVEALAAGCPVIAYRKGGSQDFIKPSINGVLFDRQTTDSLAAALQKFQNLDFNKQDIINSAAKFSPDHFRQGIKTAVNDILREDLSKKSKKEQS